MSRKIERNKDGANAMREERKGKYATYLTNRQRNKEERSIP